MAVREKRKISFSRGRKLLIGLNVTAMIVIALAIFLGICHLASLPQFRMRVDLTQEEAFTLSPLTVDLLRSLEVEVEVYALSQRPYGMDFTGLDRVEQEVIAYAAKLLEEY
ncbi:MAG: GldG family protein, partial [Planctomycetes bacterium]|nr:GldG family protein [Planctomycetota bacterium]